MAIEIVDFPIKNGDFLLQNVSSPEDRRKQLLKILWNLEDFSCRWMDDDGWCRIFSNNKTSSYPCFYNSVNVGTMLLILSGKLT